MLPLSGGDPMRAIALASMMAVVAGLVCILAGVFRLGFIAELLSKPIRYGYMNGIALHFAEMKDPVKDKLRRLELAEQLRVDGFHPTLGAAVDAYLADHDVDFTP